MALLSSLFLAPVTVRAVGANTAGKERGEWGALDQSKKERASGVLYLAFSMPRALQQQAIKQNSFPLN